MNNYHIIWEIDLEAETPIDAARKALEMIQNKDSLALEFKVIEAKPDSYVVDLGEVVCDNCAWSGTYGEGVTPIPNYNERVDPKGQIPTCECPACGALAYWRD